MSGLVLVEGWRCVHTRGMFDACERAGGLHMQLELCVCAHARIFLDAVFLVSRVWLHDMPAAGCVGG